LSVRDMTVFCPKFV